MNGNRPGKIIVGVSQSLPGLQALRLAVVEARQRGMPLYAVRAWPAPATTRSVSTVLWREEVSRAARRYVTDAFNAAAGGVPDDIEITVGAPSGRADIVLKDTASDDADLLIVGSSGNRWWHRRVARGCTRGAPCPVIVVPPPELARALRRVSLRRMVRKAFL